MEHLNPLYRKQQAVTPIRNINAHPLAIPQVYYVVFFLCLPLGISFAGLRV